MQRLITGSEVKKINSDRVIIVGEMGTLLVRDPDELVGRTGSGSRTRARFFPEHVPG